MITVLVEPGKLKLKPAVGENQEALWFTLKKQLRFKIWWYLNSTHNTGDLFIGQGKTKGLLMGKERVIIINLGPFRRQKPHNIIQNIPMLSRIFTYWRSASLLFQLLNAGSQAELFRQEIEGVFFAEADSLKGKTYDIKDDSKKESSQKHRDLLMSNGNHVSNTCSEPLIGSLVPYSCM